MNAARNVFLRFIGDEQLILFLKFPLLRDLGNEHTDKLIDGVTDSIRIVT
jgi:hypothetical protein